MTIRHVRRKHDEREQGNSLEYDSNPLRAPRVHDRDEGDDEQQEKNYPEQVDMGSRRGEKRSGNESEVSGFRLLHVAREKCEPCHVEYLPEGISVRHPDEFEIPEPARVEEHEEKRGESCFLNPMAYLEYTK